ncbi:GNAT family N-acetyltransferase [Ectobacillus ponti]|uniref:GNAT family N-acetyltransferase n=1 Tax=Ectobacillus ponti TaxID=2961894 RepID=A0AA42BNZ7_9BACI|nr:GNAT family N-acetyltransferase [Ectobacillus ponti]MCP8968545.1 GNAT family N-acetyltransferase [Ectobacillus ponti]
MIIHAQEVHAKGLRYTIRSAVEQDAGALSQLRLQIDGETENMDRERGEAYIDPAGFAGIIAADASHPRRLLLVAEAEGRIIGYSRCAGPDLKRFLHKVEFGLGVLQEFWGHGIGKRLMTETISWADANDIQKIVLHGVLETNKHAIELYKRLGFEIEGFMKRDRILSDGKYYSTYIMARHKE